MIIISSKDIFSFSKTTMARQFNNFIIKKVEYENEKIYITVEDKSPYYNRIIKHNYSKEDKIYDYFYENSVKPILRERKIDKLLKNPLNSGF